MSHVFPLERTAPKLFRLFLVFAIPLSLVAALHGCQSTPAWADMSLTDMNRQIDQTNFLVNRSCSGTLIDVEHGYVLTANHCIADQFAIVDREKIDDKGVVTTEKVRIAVPGTVSQLYFAGPSMVQKNSYVFNIKANDAKLDLALLQTRAKLPNTQAAKLACKDPVRGEVAYAVGNPFGVLYSSITKGIVASVQRTYPMLGIDGQDEHALLQITSGIEGGNSGGATYNADGEIIGVVVRGSAVNETVGFSVPLADVKSFLAANGAAGLYARCETK